MVIYRHCLWSSCTDPAGSTRHMLLLPVLSLQEEAKGGEEQGGR